MRKNTLITLWKNIDSYTNVLAEYKKEFLGKLKERELDVDEFIKEEDYQYSIDKDKLIKEFKDIINSIEKAEVKGKEATEVKKDNVKIITPTEQYDSGAIVEPSIIINNIDIDLDDVVNELPEDINNRHVITINDSGNLFGRNFGKTNTFYDVDDTINKINEYVETKNKEFFDSVNIATEETGFKKFVETNLRKDRYWKGDFKDAINTEINKINEMEDKGGVEYAARVYNVLLITNQELIRQPNSKLDVNVLDVKSVPDYDGMRDIKPKGNGMEFAGTDWVSGIRSAKKGDYVHVNSPYDYVNQSNNKTWTMKHEKELMKELNELSERDIQWSIISKGESTITKAGGEVKRIYETHYTRVSNNQWTQHFTGWKWYDYYHK